MQVLLPLDKIPILYYKPLDELNIGDLVRVPFRHKEIIGMVYSHQMPEDEALQKKLKPTIEKLSLPAISAKLITYIEKVASYNISSLSSVMKMVIPIDPLQKYQTKTSANLVARKIINLSQAQAAAADYLISKISPNPSVTLLNGVTGSGKTEVYFSAIAYLLKNDPQAQVLILLPEIGLTTQIIKRFQDYFGEKPQQWHSGSSKKSRQESWHQIINCSASRIVIGARSALFLPFKKLAMIIVDEEHENSYKQEDKVNYHARDMAVLRGHIEKIPVILCSATPCLETIDNCRKNKYQEITLSSRYGQSVMPDVLIADMRGKKLAKNSFISSLLQQKLLHNLLAQKQSLLFLNRRGYAPLTICKPCGYKMNCPNCSAWLVAHKASNNLLCHHCAYSCKLPKHCPECKQEDSFIACGPGVERIEEEVKLLLPNARVLNMTKDELSTPKKAQSTINKILNREIDVIVGTQVIAKGHHFPALSLVGVIDADIGLASGGDLRSAEKTYQLLHQVAGRAGREEQKGEVIIQTYQPENIIIKALVEHNREDFINYELKMRQESHMPPYSRLATIVIADIMLKRAELFAKELVKVAPYHPVIKIFGPMPAILAKLKKKYRYRILIKAEKNFNIQSYIQNWLKILPPPSSSLQVKIDIDPYYFN